MAKTKVMLALTDEALALLSAHASERKRGELASKAIVTLLSPKPAEPAQGKPVLDGGILERVEKLLERVATKL